MLLDRLRYWLKSTYYRVLFQQQGTPDTQVERSRRHKTTRLYIYNPTQDRPKRQLVFLGMAALAAVFVFSAVQLIGYGVDYIGARRASNELRQTYYDPVETEPPMVEETPLPALAVTPETLMTALPTATNEPAPTATAATRLEKVKYPGNPYGVVSDRFLKLKRQNPDIVGWMTIDGLIDEAIVQRDNEYYLNRDYRGYHNVNGAIFLDENCDLRTRPYTLMLYGHNMKTGLMFGGLRNYENPAFYHKNPFITFDTAYEEGRYVVFSVATVSLDAKNWRFVNLSWLLSSSASLRAKAISSLNRFSLYYSSIDVQPEDQLLLLITCVDEPTDRRIVTARRIREGESEEALKQQVRLTRLK